MITKVVSNVQKALEGVADNMTLMIGGFGLCGIPENSIAELVAKGTKNLTCISNNAGVDNFGLGLLLQKKQIKNYRQQCAQWQKRFLNTEQSGWLQDIEQQLDTVEHWHAQQRQQRHSEKKQNLLTSLADNG